MNLIEHTLDEFETSTIGQWLREGDYYTWAVWKSGIEIRTADHIAHKRLASYYPQASKYLALAQEDLVMPPEETRKPELRLDELSDTKAKLYYAITSLKKPHTISIL